MAKKYIKEQIYVKAFTDLKLLQANHSKVKHIKYEKFETQEYLKSPKYTFKEASTLLALRSRTVNIIKANSRLFSQNDLLCPLCLKDEDTQEHCLNCPKLMTKWEPLGIQWYILKQRIRAAWNRKPVCKYLGEETTSSRWSTRDWNTGPSIVLVVVW